MYLPKSSSTINLRTFSSTPPSLVSSLFPLAGRLLAEVRRGDAALDAVHHYRSRLSCSRKITDFPLTHTVDCIIVFDHVNAFNCVNVLDSDLSAGGRHSLIVVPLETFKPPDVSFSYVFNVIADDAGTPEKALDETVGEASL